MSDPTSSAAVCALQEHLRGQRHVSPATVGKHILLSSCFNNASKTSTALGDASDSCSYLYIQYLCAEVYSQTWLLNI